MWHFIMNIREDQSYEDCNVGRVAKAPKMQSAMLFKGFYFLPSSNVQIFTKNETKNKLQKKTGQKQKKERKKKTYGINNKITNTALGYAQNGPWQLRHWVVGMTAPKPRLSGPVCLQSPL